MVPLLVVPVRAGQGEQLPVAECGQEGGSLLLRGCKQVHAQRAAGRGRREAPGGLLVCSVMRPVGLAKAVPGGWGPWAVVFRGALGEAFLSFVPLAHLMASVYLGHFVRCDSVFLVKPWL